VFNMLECYAPVTVHLAERLLISGQN